MENDKGDHRYVFVCGLPRSGTSVLGRNIARLEQCTGFKNTGVLEDEGQFLQDVYASDHEHGGAGSFGFHPHAHLTETSDLLTPRNALRLRECWQPYWDTSKNIRVEKTPSNLVMTRFLQAVFPNSYFIVMKRHPVAVSMATQKWKDSVRSLNHLFEHWLHCHELFEQDKRYLSHVYELAYEDYIQNPDKYHQEIASFVGTCLPEPPKQDTFRYVVEWRNPVGRRVPESAMEETSATYDQKYFRQWNDLLRNSFFKSYYRYLAEKYESRFIKYGYSLTEGLGVRKHDLQSGRQISAVIGPLLCVGANVGALLRRLSARAKEWLRITSKKVLPELIVDKIRRARQGKSFRTGNEKLASPQV